MPPTHTIVIEANITSSNTKKNNRKINSHLCQRIWTTCGDANALVGHKHIEPALCLYMGAIVMCIDNKHLKDKVPRGNGTVCQVMKIKLKQDAPSHKWKNFYGRKVWTVNAKDVEYVECEHVHKTARMLQLETQIKNWTNQLEHDKQQNQTDLDKIKFNISKTKTLLSTITNDRKFKLEPEICLPKISIKQFSYSTKPIEFQCKMKQIQVNRNDATTGHKLQGISKDVIIITSWPTGGLAAMFKNWEYVVLSRVRTLSGLFLIKPIDMDKSFKPSEELKKYMERARQKESNLMEQRKVAISNINWSQT